MLAMKQFRAVLGDSVREAIDRKALYVMFAISTLCIIFCFGVSYRPTDVNTLMKKQVERLRRIESRRLGHRSMTSLGGEFELVSAKAIGELAPEKEANFEVSVRFESEKQLLDLVRWMKARGASPFGDMPNPEDLPEPTEAEKSEFFARKWKTQGWDHVEASQSDDPLVWNLRLGAARYVEVPGAYKESWLFGALETGMRNQSVASKVVNIQAGIANGVLGVLGILILIFSCAGFVPSMLQKGSLDLILARPIGRTRLLLYKYVGGMAMVTFSAFYLVVGCWLALGIKTGFWGPSFLLSIGVEILIFAVIYSILVFFGVWTRSGTVAGLITLGIWWISGLIVGAHDMAVAAPQFVEDWNPGIVKALNTVYLFVPKTGHLANLNLEILARSELSEKAANRLIESQLPPVDWWVSGGTTAAFAAVMLLLAAWMFRRRDY